MTRALADPRTTNPVVLSGDVHANWASDVLTDYRDHDAKPVATEFVGTSISSGGDGFDQSPESTAVMAENPHVKFTNGQRGYVRCTVDERQWRTDYRVVPYVSRAGAPVATRASFVVADGHPGLRAA